MVRRERDCPECAVWRRVGWEAIVSGLALVVAALLIAPPLP